MRETLFTIASIVLGLAYAIGVFMAFAWLLNRLISAIPAKRSVNPIPVGSARLIDVRNPTAKKLFQCIAILFGLAGTIGTFMYFSAGAGYESIMFIGFAMMLVGTIAVGIIYGTNDRDFYL